MRNVSKRLWELNLSVINAEPMDFIRTKFNFPDLYPLLDTICGIFLPFLDNLSPVYNLYLFSSLLPGSYFISGILFTELTSLMMKSTVYFIHFVYFVCFACFCCCFYCY